MHMCPYAHVRTCTNVYICACELMNRWGWDFPFSIFDFRVLWPCGGIELRMGSDENIVFEGRMSKSQAPSPGLRLHS